MRIAVFVLAYPVPSETFVKRHVAGLIARGHEVTVLTAETGRTAIDAEVPGIISIFGTSARSRRWKIRSLVSAFVALFSKAGRRRVCSGIRSIPGKNFGAFWEITGSEHRNLGKFDAIIAHFGPGGVRALYQRQAGLLEGPIATVFHGYDMSRTAIVDRFMGHYRRLFRETELMLPISDAWAGRLKSWGALPERIEVLRMGVDLDRFAVPDFDCPLAQPLRILSVARLEEKKGLFDAIAGASRASVDIDYTIVGSGQLEEPLRAEAGRVGQGRVHLAGARPHAEVFRLLTETDVFLLPSITAQSGDMEGIPVALMEAMAMGAIVITTRHSGIPELVEDGVTGLLVDEGDADAIARKIESLARGEVDVPAMRRAARDRVSTMFNNALLDDQLERICQRLAGQAATA